MRVLSYLVAIVLASSCAAPAVALISDKTNLSKFNSGIEIFSQTVSGDQTKRYLRSYDNADDEYEERAGLNNLDEVLSKLKITGRASTSGLTKVDDIISRFDDIAQKYPRGLSSSTKNQLVQVEKQRARDVYELVKMNKKKPDGMQRYIEPFPGMKVDPGFSHVGRERQRYEGGKRLLSCSVISRPEREGGGDVLLISSSNPNKHEWLLPKGGWDYGEDLHTSAQREAREEGGVKGEIVGPLGTWELKNRDGEGRIYHAFKMEATTVYDQWSESMRYRLWVSYDDAIKLLGNREEMVDIVKAARDAN